MISRKGIPIILSRRRGEPIRRPVLGHGAQGENKFQNHGFVVLTLACTRFRRDTELGANIDQPVLAFATGTTFPFSRSSSR